MCPSSISTRGSQTMDVAPLVWEEKADCFSSNNLILLTCTSVSNGGYASCPVKTFMFRVSTTGLVYESVGKHMAQMSSDSMEEFEDIRRT